MIDDNGGNVELMDTEHTRRYFKRSKFEEGQESLEYLAILAGTVAIIVIVIFFRPYLWSYLSATWQNVWLTQQESTVEIEGVGEVTLGTVTIEAENIVKVIALDTISLPNCNGSSELTISREYQRSIQQNIEYTNSAELSIDTSRFLGDISAHIYDVLHIENISEIRETSTVEVSAAPGTSVTYSVDWIETQQVGTVEVTKGDAVYLVEFTFPSTLKIQVKEPASEVCE
jgi:hypothetical protein